MWLRLSRAGEGTGNGKSEFQRIKNSSKVNHHGYAPLYTLRKDHKPIEDPLAGPPTRPVCGGSAAYNHKLSHILGYFLRPVWQESDTTCTSTEELLAAFEDVNQKQILDEDCEIGSLDVKALYPSLDVQFASKIVGKMFLDSKVVVPALDIRELGLYLALNKTPDELREVGLLEFCPTRRSRRGRPPNMTGCGTKEQLEERFKSFAEAQNKEPDEYTKKRMLAEAITIGVQFIMTNHVYMFNKVIRKQTKGGPIGLALTGDVAQVFMVWWDRELIGRARIQGLEFILYKRYVDDINNITRRIRNPGITLPPDKTNTTEVKQIANGIHKSISVTSDCPSEHEDEKIPILDVKAWLQRLQEENGNSQVFIMYEFYYKEVASRAVVNARSAIPIETMRTILTQEVLRILRNCSRRLPWKTISTHVENFCARMQYSGHGQTMRTQVVRSALSAYRKIIQKDLTGEVPMHRPRDWNKEERVKNKRKKKKGWFRGRKGQNETVIFIPVTPSSDLKKRYQKVIKKAGIKVAVVEVPGRSLKRRLQRSDPFKPDFCSKRDSCMVCESREGRGGGRCRIEGVTYSVNCSGCDCVYVGETGRNAFSRGLEHRAAILKKDITSPLYSHSVDDHDGQSVTFNMHVTGSFGGDALKRQISEGVNIQETPAHFILNRRDEWRQTLLPRVQVCSTN